MKKLLLVILSVFLVSCVGGNKDIKSPETQTGTGIQTSTSTFVDNSDIPESLNTDEPSTLE